MGVLNPCSRRHTTKTTISNSLSFCKWLERRAGCIGQSLRASPRGPAELIIDIKLQISGKYHSEHLAAKHRVALPLHHTTFARFLLLGGELSPTAVCKCDWPHPRYIPSRSTAPLPSSSLLATGMSVP
ncbi:hypothetical protein BGX38DRAFT_737055 [Terfezia claveryi]|nr:hypothetical protein BGX38DRAFT_737055 [Terfezia claveryi]